MHTIIVISSKNQSKGSAFNRRQANWQVMHVKESKLDGYGSDGSNHARTNFLFLITFWLSPQVDQSFRSMNCKQWHFSCTLLYRFSAVWYCFDWIFRNPTAWSLKRSCCVAALTYSCSPTSGNTAPQSSPSPRTKSWTARRAICPKMSVCQRNNDKHRYFDDENKNCDIHARSRWQSDPNSFKDLQISAVGLINISMYARTGASTGVIGLTEGKVTRQCIIVIDVFPLLENVAGSCLGSAFRHIVLINCTMMHFEQFLLTLCAPFLQKR